MCFTKKTTEQYLQWKTKPDQSANFKTDLWSRNSKYNEQFQPYMFSFVQTITVQYQIKFTGQTLFYHWYFCTIQQHKRVAGR